MGRSSARKTVAEVPLTGLSFIVDGAGDGAADLVVQNGGETLEETVAADTNVVSRAALLEPIPDEASGLMWQSEGIYVNGEFEGVVNKFSDEDGFLVAEGYIAYFE